MRGQPGTTTTIRILWWDGDLPVEGDFLIRHTGTCYMIERWRPAKSPSAKIIGTFDVVRLEDDAVELGQEGVYEIVSARR